ncbi:MAG: hypothetical protein HYU03_03485 [Thaumarchaeota archaeon]|nr:hypothetical protein [Nitrososphaerota archaeon]
MSTATRVSTKVAVIAITAVLYALAKGATAFISTPWGVGQLLIGIFVPAFMAVVAHTLSVAVGAGMGTFLGDLFFLTPLGQTNPALSLVAGVPANFLAFLLFGWFVKKYRSWSAFVAATVSFVTLGNFIAGFSVVVIGSALFTNLQKLFSAFNPAGLILGFTLFWASTMIPAILIAVPLLVRAVRPLRGRSSVLTDYPSWSAAGVKSQLRTSIIFAIVFLLLGVFFFVASPGSLVIFPGLTSYFVVAVVSVLILGPLAGAIAGSRLPGGRDGSKNI